MFFLFIGRTLIGDGFFHDFQDGISTINGQTGRYRRQMRVASDAGIFLSVCV
jgi:hypothetical protein